MSRTIRKTDYVSGWGFRRIRTVGLIKGYMVAIEEIEEYTGRCTHNRIRNTGRIPTAYDDIVVAALAESVTVQ